MKVEIKNFILVMIAGILAISGAFGQSEGEIVEKIKLGLHLEKFKKVKVVNNLNLLFKGAKVELVNEHSEQSTTVNVVGKEDSVDFEIGAPYKFVFTLTLEPQSNSPDQLPFISGKKSVEVSSGKAIRNDVFSDVTRKPTGKVNVLFEKDPSEKDTLLVTIK